MTEHEQITDAEVISGSELELRPQTATTVTLFGTDNPAAMVAKAMEVAEALADVIRKKELSKRIERREFVFVEGWTLLGSMLGVFPVLESCEPVTLDGIDGFEAIVSAQTLNGNVVGRAKAYCMKNERNWRNRDHFAIASMAQTRATSKALRQPLGFVMQLAGYAPTPVEEMDELRSRDEATQSDKQAVAERPALLTRFTAGLEKLKDKPEWQLEAILENSSTRWGRMIESVADLTTDELFSIVEAMNHYGKAGV